MKRSRVVAWSLLVAMLGAAVHPPVGGAGSTAALGAAPPEEPEDLISADQRNVLGWALRLFDEADLVLPPLDVVAHSGTKPCEGRHGSASYHPNHVVIDLCGTLTGAPLEFLLLHELAHAWAEYAIDEATRRDFLADRGLESWRDRDVAWHERGTEHAAEIVVWALMDRPVRIVRIPDAGCDALGRGYRLLTGSTPLHGYRDLCSPDHVVVDRVRGPRNL